ncbi:monovalent cation/H+ antiporter subunit D [Crenalkalicoccus roseus]|uniref:monovalent cation/H+ antiporter subunit D n=1 Tax=Crenalkalicoccus roseus TaxID=1485588 RepID=UPI001081965B|nr:monovalent cation/H+ antiporter subunit D [Crenalkalicoccus roseus]
MTGWIVLPIVLPAAVAAFLLLALSRDLQRQRIVSATASLLLLAIAVHLQALASDGVTRPYFVGAWPAPFGITLVLDGLSATLVLLNAALAAAVVIYAAGGWDARGRHFHPMFHFLMMGVNGAFLTGDVFNLFVFFEVMLIASYGLMLHGGGAPRLRAGFHYVAINLTGSTLFLFAVSLIYAVTGTLNMADLAVKIPAVRPEDAALLRTGGLLLIVVFAIKAALAPLHWWLPNAYAAAPGPSAAVFMIMTKIGAYAILRVSTLIFGPEAGAVAGLAAPWILPAALLTLGIGAAGVLAGRRLVDIACFAALWSMGSLLVAVGLLDGPGISAALYYTVHSTLAGAALFLLADLVAERRGRWRDRLAMAPPIAQALPLSAMFFVAAIAVAGLPPLSGFLGKVLILDAARASAWGVWVWAVLLGTSLVVILGFSRAGSALFWKTRPAEAGAAGAAEARAGLRLGVVGVLLGATLLLSVFAGPLTRGFDAVAAQVLAPSGYVAAVLGGAPAAPGMRR